MKRSTIILIIFLVLLIITPIVIVKTVNNLSPESKLKGIQTLWNKSDPNTPTRYIITEEYFGSDSIGTTINITTDADSESTLIDNHRYDEDTIRISGNAHSSYNIIYEEEVNLIIENKNPNIKFKIANANLSKISLNSSGETDIVSSNLGTLIFQDSINTAPIRLLQNNIGGTDCIELHKPSDGNNREQHRQQPFFQKNTEISLSSTIISALTHGPMNII